MDLGTRLFVSNLPENTNENDLRIAFSSYGQITNVDLKSKTEVDNNIKKFAFITLSSSNYDVETCIKHFSDQEFKGNKLYVTRARESFLERLQREREQAQKKTVAGKNEDHFTKIKKDPVIRLGDKLNPRKRKIDKKSITHYEQSSTQVEIDDKLDQQGKGDDEVHLTSTDDKKKKAAEKKRLESLQKKRREFKEKQRIIKTCLTSIDKCQNKKVIFSDDETSSPKLSVPLNSPSKLNNHKNRNTLFDDDSNDDENISFKINKQYEGKEGQKVLELQSRYKSDKRFILDERFITEEESEDEKENEKLKQDDEINLMQTDEKSKQLEILQDVLGVQLKPSTTDPAKDKKVKYKPAMLRYDPLHPEHSKYLMPVEETKIEPKKKDKRKTKKEEHKKDAEEEQIKVDKVEVSKEQFYKVSDSLKEAMNQPGTFSLRSLFSKNEDNGNTEPNVQETGHIPLKPNKEKKVKNPLAPDEKNPFVYDSSDSETDEVDKDPNKDDIIQKPLETKAVWRENFFFSDDDQRLKEGLLFFTKVNQNEVQKERRELKSLMKKRLYNTERKNQMFKKKIGGRKKSMKKKYVKK